MASTHVIEVQMKFLQTAAGLSSSINSNIAGAVGNTNKLGQMLTSGAAFYGLEKFGQAGKKVFGGMIEQATLLQSALARVQIATGANAREMKGFQDLIRSTSSKYSMDTSQSSNMLAVMARTGMSRGTISATFDAVSKYASIQQFERGVDYEQSAKLAATTARLYGARSPEQTERVLNNLYRAMNTTPMAPGQILTSLQNFAPVGMKLGMSQEETFQAAALMGTMGLGSKGGTGLFNMMMRSVGKTASMTGHREDKQTKALHELGIHAGMSFGSIVNQLVSSSTSMGAKGQSAHFIQDLIAAFNDRGGRVAAALSSPDAQKNLQDLLASWKDVTDLNKAMEIEQKTLAFQTGVVSSNFRMLESTLGETATTTMPKFQARLAGWISAIDSKVKGSPLLSSTLGVGVAAGETASFAASLFGKLGLGLTAFNSMRGLYGQVTGKGGGGQPVYVTNWPGGGFGSGLGSALSGVAGGAVGGVSISAIASVVGVALAAEGGLVGLAMLLKQSLDKDLGAAKDRLLPKDEAQVRGRTTGAGAIVLSDKDKLAMALADRPTIHIAGDVHVQANDAHGFAKSLGKAADRHSGKSKHSATHSTSSGYGGKGGP